MNFFKQHTGYFTVAFCLLITTRLVAQDCDSNYFSFTYTASDFLTYSKALVAPDNSVVCLQTNKLYAHGLTKLTPQGNVIFSYNYTAPFIANSYHAWTDLFFTDMAVASDGNIYVTGSVTKHGVFYDDTETPPARTAAVLTKIDKYGAVIWSRFLANQTTDPLSFSNVIVLSNGDVVCYLTTQVALPYYGKVVCLSADGTIKWNITLNTGVYSSGSLAPSNKIAMLQTENGNIVIADIVSHYTDNSATSNEFHFIALQPSNGAITWETSYDYGQGDFIPNIVSVCELPNQNLSFQTTWNDVSNGTANGVSDHLNIITNSQGSIQKMITTSINNDFLVSVDGKLEDSQGNQSALLLTSDGNTVLMKVDADGQLIWNRRYGKADGGIPPTCFVPVNNRYDIVLSDFSRSFRLLVTDPIGRLDCDTLPLTLMQKELPAFTGNANNIHTIDSLGPNESPYYTGFFVVQNTTATSIQKNTVCQKTVPCCTDIVDTAHINAVSLCEGASYTLPDQTIVKDSGLYYSVSKTAKGCDSIALYKITVYKNPVNLSIGQDTCFDKNDSIVLQATGGYSNYLWMRTVSTTKSQFTIHTPGVYYVNVSNICGSKTDSIHVYEGCDFPIYMPNAFTPNGDQLNDVFKVPSLNINRFVRLTIYNRWGKVIFQSNTIANGWDGTDKGLPQNAGMYVYYLEMENLTGKRITQKGAVMLLR